MKNWNIYRWTKATGNGVSSHGKNEGIWEMSGQVDSEYILITEPGNVPGMKGDFQGSHVCTIYPGCGDLGREIAEGNARLIAAAPKMLLALKKALPYMHDLNAENFDDIEVGIFKDFELEKTYMTILSAIALATNEDVHVGDCPSTN